MIVKGNSRSAGGWWAGHLMRADTNERVEVVEISGLGAETIRDGFSEMEAVASGTHCTNYAYIVSLNPRENEQLTREQWLWAVDRTAQELGLAGQPRMIVQHDKEGRQHWHVVWSRIDADSMTAISDSLTYPKHERAARAIEQELELEPVASVLVKDRDTPRPDRRPRDYEGFRAQQSGIDPQDVAAELRTLWQEADSGTSFRAAIEEVGYVLARGDKRVFVVIDRAGDEHSLGRRLGVKAAALRERMGDIDDALPSVAEARELAAANAEGDANTGGDAPQPQEKEPAPTPLDEQQAAAFHIEPDAVLSETTAHDLAARFGDDAESLPGAQSRRNESIPGEQPRDDESASGSVNAAEQDKDPSATADCHRTHSTGEQPQRVTRWSFAGLAQRLTHYADMFWGFVQDERSGQQPEAAREADAEAPSEEPAAAPDVATTPTTAVEEQPGGGGIFSWAKRLFHRDAAPPSHPSQGSHGSPEPGGEPARPRANGQALAPDGADPPAETTAGSETTPPIAPPLADLESYRASFNDAPEPRENAPAPPSDMERYRATFNAEPEPDAAKPVPPAPAPTAPEIDFD